MEERIIKSIEDLKTELKQDISEIKTELKEHRKTEKDILVEIGKIKTHLKWLFAIGLAITGLLVKQFFFT